MRTSYRLEQYVKAGLVFAATTATYFFARATGVLPSWLNSEKSETTDIAVSKPATIQPMGVAAYAVADDFSFDDLSVTDFEEVDLTSPRAELAIERSDAEEQYRVNTELKHHPVRRRLLQLQQSPVIIVNPIPDQVIEATQPYTYPLGNVFSGNFTAIGAVKAGESSLPAWMNLLYLRIGSANIAPVGNMYGLSLQNGYAYVTRDNGIIAVDVQNPVAPWVMQRCCNEVGWSYRVIAKNEVAFMTAYPSGLAIANISNPGYPSLISFYPISYARGLDVQNNLVFVASIGMGLQIIDASNFSHPILIGYYNSTCQYNNFVVINNNIAFFSSTSIYQNTCILNVSDPRNPILMTTLEEGGYSVIQNSTLYVANYNRLSIVNVSNIFDPKTITTYPLVGYPTDLAVSEGLILIAKGNAGLEVIDASNLRNLRTIGSYQANTINAVKAEGNLVYVTNLFNDGGTLDILDLNMAQLSGVKLSSYVGSTALIDVFAINQAGIITDDQFHLAVDIYPYLLNSALLDQSLFPNSSVSISFNSKVLFTSSTSTFLSISLGSKNGVLPNWVKLFMQPTLLGVYNFNNYPFYSLAINQNLLYAFVYNNLNVYDISNPISPILINSISNIDSTQNIFYLNNLLLLEANVAKLEIFNLSNASSPRLVGSFPSNPQGVIAYNTSVIMVLNIWNFFSLDITNATDPLLINQFNVRTTSNSFAFQNNRLYIGENGGLEIVDVSAITKPISIGYYAGSNLHYFSKVAVHNEQIFVGMSISSLVSGFWFYTGGIYIFDTVGPNLMASYDILPSWPNGMEIINNMLFITMATNGIYIFDISNIYNLKLLSIYNTGNAIQPECLLMNGKVAYLATGLDLEILDLSQWQLTLQPMADDVGNYDIIVTATDELGGNVSTTFTIRVEGPPQIHGVIPAQYAKVNQAFNYFVSQGLITDPNFDPIIFTAILGNNQSLPAWLQFNAISATFSGTPQSSDVGNYTLVLSATDHIAGAVNTSFNLLINNVPALNQPISSQLANIGSIYQLTLPANTFSNPNSGALIYSAQQSNGLALPAWLTFNATQRSFLGLPQSGDVGRYGLSVVAVDQYNGQATAPFILLVEYPPQVNQLIVSKFAGVNAAFIYPISANTFIDPSGNSLIYSATQLSGAVLPNWLSFNPETLIFSGTPLSTNIGILEVELTATNLNGGQAQQSFNVTVTYFPQIGQSIPAQLVDVGVFYELILSNTTFTDPDDPVLIYSAQWNSHPRLPQWLNFNETFRQFSGIPNTTDTGEYDLSVSASDMYGATATASLMLVVDHFPRLNRPIVSQLAGAGFPYSLAIPANTFTDPDDDLLTYQIQSMSSAGLPHWLSFNPQTLVLAGVPQITDLGDLTLGLIATDPQGGKGQQNFNLSVIQFPVAAATISDQLVDIGFPYRLTIAGNTFQYPNLTALAYFAQQSNGAGLPTWLQFNATALIFQGTPNLTDAGLLTLAVIAANNQGGQAQVTFTLRVEAFPRVNQLILAQLVGVNLPFILNVPANTFLDDDDDSLVYQASQTNGVALPNWLSFNPFAFSFSGVPQVTDLGEFSVSVKAIDPYGGWAQQSFNLTVIYFPKLVQSLMAQLVDVGTPYQWTLPNTTFQDPGGRALSYSTQQKNGLQLPGWLQFNEVSLQFLGIPNSTDVGSMNITLIAKNSAGAQTTGQFTLQVEHFPQWQRILSDQWAGVGIAFSFTLPADTVVDLDGEPLVYQASTGDDSPLPNWLSFNKQSLTFLGVPLQINVGALPILLTVTDSAGASVTGNFTINVIYFPTVIAALPAPSTVWSGQNFTYAVPATTFSDPDDIVQSYQATLADGETLPAWLKFNASALVFSGIPSDNDAGTLSILVIAQGAHQIQISASLSLLISANIPPQLVNPISDQTATVGELFKFYVPANTFVDPEGEPLNYTATQAGTTNLPDWLNFDESGLYFSGTPQGGDTDAYSARTVPIVLTAKDTRSQSQAIFNINVLGTSNWQFAVKVSTSLISIFTAMIAVYRERALFLNRCNKKHYQYPPQTVATGSLFTHQLSTAPEHIHKIEVKLSEPAHGRCRFFRSDQRILPGNPLLPSWMDYDTNTNTLRSKGVVPFGTPQDLIISVKGSGGVILEQFKLTVTASREEKAASLLEASGAGSPVSPESGNSILNLS